MDEQDGQLVRCTTRLRDGQDCRTVLWRAWPNRILVRIRGGEPGEYHEIEAEGPALAFIRRCSRCHTRWLPLNPLNPTLAGASGGVLKPVA